MEARHVRSPCSIACARTHAHTHRVYRETPPVRRSGIADRGGASALTKLADNQSNFGLVVGTPIKDWQHLDLTAPAVTFPVNGAQIGPTAGLVPGGHSAFEVLKGMVPNAYDYCGGLKVGHYVTCGALSGLHFTEAGAEVVGSIAGIGDVAVTIGK